MRRSVIRVVVAIVPLMIPLASLNAQQEILLRFRPAPGHVVRILSTYTAAMTFKNLMGEGLPQDAGSLSVEAEIMQSITDRVRSVGGAVTVDRTVDSTRATARLAGLVQSGTADARQRATARVVISDRLEVLDFAVTEADSLTALVESALRTPIGYEFALPEQPIRPGDTWVTTLRFPFQSIDDNRADQTPGLDTAVVAEATFRLDSIVVRAGDTLAYLGVRGNFQPVTMTETAVQGVSGSGTISGALAGTLIWSAGWNAFGSGAIRAVLAMDFALLDGGRRAALSIEFDVVNRFEIRP